MPYLASLMSERIIGRSEPLALLSLGLALATNLALPVEAMAQTTTPYCTELKELNNYAMNSQRFAPILGQVTRGITARPAYPSLGGRIVHSTAPRPTPATRRSLARTRKRHGLSNGLPRRSSTASRALGWRRSSRWGRTLSFFIPDWGPRALPSIWIRSQVTRTLCGSSCSCAADLSVGKYNRHRFA